MKDSNTCDSQEWIEYALCKAIWNVTGVNFFESERLLIEQDEVNDYKKE